MKKTNIIRKASFGKTFAKSLVFMTVIAVVICLIVTGILNSVLQNTLKNNEKELISNVERALASGLEDNNLSHLDAVSVNNIINGAPKTIGKDITVYIDDEQMTSVTGLHVVVRADAIKTDLSDMTLVVKVSDSGSDYGDFCVYSSADDRPYVDQVLIGNIVPFANLIMKDDEAVTEEECYVEEFNTGAIVTQVAYADGLTSSDYSETLVEKGIVYDSTGNIHFYSIKSTPNLYMTSVFSNTNGAMFIFYGLVYLVCICVAVVAALITFNRDKRIYDEFSYRTNLTNILAHDLKTPLMAISSYAENYESIKDSSKKDYYVSKISENASYMNSLIEGTLKLSSAENNAIVSKENINVKSVVDDVLVQLDFDIKNKKLKINKSEITEKNINTDKVRFKSALVAVIENAVKFSLDGEEIVINSSDDSILKVTNKYEGTIVNQNKLKDVFVTGNDARGEKQGSGLGLAIADKELSNLGMSLNIEIKDNDFIVTIK